MLSEGEAEVRVVDAIDLQLTVRSIVLVQG